MNGIRTVIVDDDPAVLRLHAGYLAAVPGFMLVATARTGAEAARLAARTDVDFVLLDVNLPDFSGVEVLHRLRIVREWDLDVMVISSARDATTVRQALSARVVGYLAKPFTREAFAARLERYRDARADRIAEAALPLGQGDIDALFSARREPAPAPGDGAIGSALPKGLSAATLELILTALDPVRPVTVRDLAAQCGASVPTVRRYLDHLTRTGVVTVSHRFGARGRPEVLYRRAPA